ncbi:MAG: TonB-dependent receptor plug domain-containing protein [Bacteroidales bacterium]|nr:TonB-dependent receptor plug domain-containing protein [Bacteroidales bacterium]
MTYKLKWKRRKSVNILKSFVASTILLTPVSEIFAQQDTAKTVLLETAKVTWVRPSGELPFAGTTINRSVIENSSGNGSINNLLELVPSMVTSSDAGTGIGNTSLRIRGIDHTRINTTINGIELNDAESQGTWFVNLPSFGNYVDNFSLQRGVGTSTNGAAAFGASMDFSTLSPSSRPFAEFSSAAGSFNTFKNSVALSSGLIKNRFAFTAAYTNLQSDGYIDRSSANLNSMFITGEYRLLNKEDQDFGTLSFNILHGAEKTGLAWDGVPSEMLETNHTYNGCGIYYDDDGNVQYYDNETDNYKQTHYQLFYKKIFRKEKMDKLVEITVNAGLHLTRGIGYYEQYKDDEKFSDYGLSDFATENDTLKRTDLVTRKYLDNYFYGFVFNVSQRFYSKNDFVSKVTWDIGGSLNRYDGDHYGEIVWMQYGGNVPPFDQWYFNRAHKTQGNIYGKISYRPIKKMLIYGDLQYRRIDYTIDGMDDNLADITQEYDWNFVNPKVGISYQFGNKHKQDVYFSFAISHREPTRSDIVDAPAGNKPTAERLYDFEVGFNHTSRKFAFNVNAYYMNYKDQLVLTGQINDMGDAIMVNVAQSYRTGIEVVSAYRPTKFFTWKINGTFSLNKIQDYKHYVDDYDNWGAQIVEELGTTDISFSPGIIAGNEFIFTPLKRFNISLLTKFAGKQYLDNASDDHHAIKPYSFTNLQLSYLFEFKERTKLSLFFQVNNIFNMRYESGGWLYRYVEGGAEYHDDGYYSQAGINFMGGVTVKIR